MTLAVAFGRTGFPRRLIDILLLFRFIINPRDSMNSKSRYWFYGTNKQRLAAVASYQRLKRQSVRCKNSRDVRATLCSPLTIDRYHPSSLIPRISDSLELALEKSCQTRFRTGKSSSGQVSFSLSLFLSPSS